MDNTPQTLDDLQHVPGWRYPPEAYKAGRTDVVRPEVFEAVCEAISAGHMLTAICRDLGWHPSAIHGYKRNDPQLEGRWDEVREQGQDAMAEDAVTIVDGLKPVPGVLSDVGRDKARADTRLRLLAKLNPRKFGERVQLADANGEKLALAPLVGDVMAMLRGAAAQPVEVVAVEALPAPEASKDASDLV